MWPLKPLYASFMAFFSGALFPLDILPAPFNSILQYTPFAFFGFVNTQALQGALSTAQIASFLVVSLTWNIGCLALYAMLWRKGLRRYEGVNA